MRVSVIIPTYNRAKYIAITIKSLLSLNYPKDCFEIIVVDNNSTDDTFKIVQPFVENASGVKVRYIFEPRQGVHYARNTAAKQCNGEILYFTDDDMIADPELLNELVKVFVFDERVAVATGKVLPKWENEPPQWIVRHCSNYLLSLLDADYDFFVGSKINYLYSCHQAIKRNVFFLAEGFNPEYTKNKYMGDGESGLNAKVEALGYKFGYNSRSVTYHIIPKQRFTQSYLNRRLANNGIAHSYSAFKRSPKCISLIKQIVKKGVFKFPVELIKGALLLVLKRDISLSRFLLAKCFYYFNSILFDFQILFNPELRRFVVKSDWVTNDQEFDNIKL